MEIMISSAYSKLQKIKFRGGRKTRDYLQFYAIAQHSNFSFSDNTKRIAISMVRDEFDILDVWLDHLLENFDRAVIVDHCSKPQAASKLKKWCLDNESLYIRLDIKAYIQEAVFNVVSDLVTRDNSTNIWLYPIDADEFFSHQTLKIIEEICSKTSSAISLPWRNAYPAEIFEDPKNLMLETDLFLFSRRSTVHKTIINTNMVRRDGARWLAGNHLAVDAKGNFLNSQKWHNAYILHIPIRSKDQFTEKLKKGNEAYSELEKYRKRKNMGFHWQIDTNLFSGLNFEFYMSKVCYYSENLQENRDVSARKKVRGSLKYFIKTY
jgi:hypothetical protein